MKTFWLEKNECTGCGACANICPVSAISLNPDWAGFDYPQISDVCIDCNKCEKICHDRLSLGSVDPVPRTFGVRSKDSDVRFSSTSGGAFTELARTVLAEDGLVIAATYDGAARIKHVSVSDEADLSELRQSKYAQSSIGETLLEMRDALERGRHVLFCGAPCQVAGAKAFLGKDYSGFCTIDFICRGVNSPKALDAWAREVAQDHGCEIEQIWFKYKEHGWKLSPRCTRVDFTDGTSQVFDQSKNLFMCGYLEQNLYMRPSCAQCDFKGDNRRSDITLGDFWGLDGELDDDKGTTLLLVNSKTGMRLFERTQHRFDCFERSFSEVDRGNVCFRGSVSLNPRSDNFFEDLDRMSFSKALKKNSKKRPFVSKVKSYLFRKIKKIKQKQF